MMFKLLYVNIARDDDLYTCIVWTVCAQTDIIKSEIMLKGLFTYVASVRLN